MFCSHAIPSQMPVQSGVMMFMNVEMLWPIHSRLMKIKVNYALRPRGNVIVLPRSYFYLFSFMFPNQCFVIFKLLFNTLPFSSQSYLRNYVSKPQCKSYKKCMIRFQIKKTCPSVRFCLLSPFRYFEHAKSKVKHQQTRCYLRVFITEQPYHVTV